MCGLVGVAGDLAYKDELLLQRLMMMNFFRGKDSCGVAAIRHSGFASVAKAALYPPDLFDTQKFKTAMSASSTMAFIGHNRHSTMGATNNVNAHPFECGTIIGAHNGTLEKESKDWLEDKLGQTYGTDSEALFWGIDKLGVNEVIPNLFKGRDQQKGAWALTWFDSKDNSLNFLRNAHRPLWYAWEDNFKKFYWASEWPMIQHGVQMGVGFKLATKFETVTEEGKKRQKEIRYFKFDEDIHYSINLDELRKNETGKLPKFKVQKLEGKAHPVYVPMTGNYGGTGNNPYDPFDKGDPNFPEGQNICGFRVPNTTARGQTTASTTTSQTSGRTSKKTIDLLGDATDPLAGYMTEAQFKAMFQHGCGYCGDPVSFNDYGLTIYEREGQVMCSLCSGHFDIDPKNPPPTQIIMTPSTIDNYLK
jgi:predicted glutamine amidotransferase